MLTTNHHKRPVAEEEKHLRFAHFRRANRVAFAADAPDSHSRHGSAAEDEAARHAHLCFVAAEVVRITVEIDGAQVKGRLGLPETGRNGAGLADQIEAELGEMLAGADDRLLRDDKKLDDAIRRIVRQVSMEVIGKKPEVTVVVSRLLAE